MYVLNTIAIIVGIAAAGTLSLMRAPFTTLEKALYYMVFVTMHEHMHSVVADNLQLLQITGKLSTFFFYKVSQLVVFPVISVWLLYALFHPRLHGIWKTVLTAGWLWGLHGTYLYMKHKDILRYSGWNWRYQYGVWLAVLALTAGFALWFRWLLRKRDNDAAAA